jgi:hypothetical protein
MADYRSSLGILNGLREQLSLRMAALLGGNPVVKLLGSQELAKAPTGQALGIYLYRLAVDPFARNRYLSPAAAHKTPRPELPVNLHILVIGWSDKTESEISYLSAAMQVIGSAMNLSAAHLGLSNPGWAESDSVQVIPEEMSTEDLTRLWDSLPSGFRLCVPYIIKTVRFEPDEDKPEPPLVKTIVHPFNAASESSP